MNVENDAKRSKSVAFPLHNFRQNHVCHGQVGSWDPWDPWSPIIGLIIPCWEFIKTPCNLTVAQVVQRTARSNDNRGDISGYSYRAIALKILFNDILVGFLKGFPSSRVGKIPMCHIV